LIGWSAQQPQPAVTEVFQVEVSAAGFVAGHAPQAAVDRLAPETGIGTDFGDDVTPRELGGAGASAELVDRVQDGVAAARPGHGAAEFARWSLRSGMVRAIPRRRSIARFARER
jgi:hypothetical protein